MSHPNFKESLALKGVEKVEPHGRNSESRQITIIPYGSQEGAPADTAPYTDQMAPKLVEKFQAQGAAELGITMFPQIIAAQNKRTGPNDKKNEVDPNHGVRNWDNVFEVYKKHFMAISQAVFLSKGKSKILGVGGDHSMGASTIRANIFAHGILDIINGKTECRHDIRKEIERLTEEFQKMPSEDNLQNLANFLDSALERDERMMSQWKNKTKEVSLVWFDAHGDINTPMTLPSQTKAADAASGKAIVEIENGELTNFLSPSPSGNYHGMPVATAMGFGPRLMLEFGSKYANIHPSNIVFLAIRDLDDAERDAVEKLRTNLGLKVFYPADLVKQGMNVYQSIISELPPSNNVIIEHDVDGGNAARYPATGTPVGPGSDRNAEPGPSHYVVRQAVRNLLLNHPNIIACDFAEGAAIPLERKSGVAASADAQDEKLLDAAETFHSTVQLVCSALGLTTLQKKQVFGDALQEVKGTDHHNDTKAKGVEGELKLQANERFISLRGPVNKLQIDEAAAKGVSN